MSAELDWGKVLAAPPSAPRPAALRDRLLDIDDWVTLAVALTAGIAVAASIQSADWVESMPALPFVAAAGLLLGYLTTRVPLQSAAARAWIAFGTFLSAGAVTVIATTLSSIEQGNAWERWNAFRDRMAAWFDIVVNGGISDDHIPFVLLVVSLTWVVSFAMAWSIFVLRNAWLALVPLALVIIGNNAYRDIEFDAALVLFLFSGILLLGRVAFQRQQAVWSREDIEAPDFVGVRASWQTAWVVAALLGLAWLLPIDSTGDTLGGLWDDIAEPINERIFDNGRFFAGIRGDQAEAFRDFGDTLPLGGSIDLRNRVQLRAEVSEPVPFLRVAAYERYESGGWLTGERTTRAGFESDLPAPAEIADRAADTDPSRIVIVDIEARRLLDQLAVPLAPLGVDEDFDATYLEPEQFRVPLGNAESSQDDLPPELEDVLPELRRTYVPPGPGEGAAFQEYGAILPDGYEPKLVEHDTQTLIVERSRSLTDALALEPADDLQRGDHYRVAALSPFATERQLRAASTEYPSDVRDAYLALPDDFPDTVRQLATQLTAGTSSPYDAALAIETYLRSIPYDESIGRPPPDVDRIEYFLFELQRGYFDYHASAMTVMLRAIGVPARLATGYALTEIDESGRYVLRERHTYSWPEVYFPGFGWIAFNPTPNLPTVPRAPGAADAATGVEPVEGGGNFGFDSLDLDALQDLGPIDVDTPEGGISTDASSNGGGFPWLWLAAGAGAAIAIPGLARLAWERPFAGLPYPAKLWGKTQLLATLAGIGPQPDQTPREFAREAQAKIDGLAQLESLALVYERSRYGIREPNDDERTQLARDYRRVRNRLLARVVRWRWTPKGEEEEM